MSIIAQQYFIQLTDYKSMQIYIFVNSKDLNFRVVFLRWPYSITHSLIQKIKFFAEIFIMLQSMVKELFCCIKHWHEIKTIKILFTSLSVRPYYTWYAIVLRNGRRENDNLAVKIKLLLNLKYIQSYLRVYIFWSNVTPFFGRVCRSFRKNLRFRWKEIQRHQDDSWL